MPCKVKLRASVGEIKKSAFDKLRRYCVEFVCDDIIYLNFAVSLEKL